MGLLDRCSGQHSDITCPVPADLSEMIRHVVSELDALLERRSIEPQNDDRGFRPCVQATAISFTGSL